MTQPPILYLKKGKRYSPAGLDSNHAYQDGVWLIQEHGRSKLLLGKLCDIPDVPKLAAMMARSFEAAGALQIVRKKAATNGVDLSSFEIVETVIKALAGEEE